jgi:hypothetical protein
MRYPAAGMAMSIAESTSHEGFLTQPRGFLLKPTCTSTCFLPQLHLNLATMLASGSSQPARQ